MILWLARFPLSVTYMELCRVEHDWSCQCNYVLTEPNLQYPQYFLREKDVPFMPLCLCASAVSASDEAVLLKPNARHLIPK